MATGRNTRDAIPPQAASLPHKELFQVIGGYDAAQYYLVFNGQCEAAFKFYERVLGGKILAMFTHAGTPAEEQVPPEWLDKIMHVTLKAGDTILMGSDAPPDHFKTPQGFSVNIAVRASGRRGTHLPRIIGERDRGDADPEDVLGRTVGHV